MLSDVFNRAPDVAFRDIDDQLVLVSADRGIIYTLNPVGAFIWHATDGTSTVQDLAGAVCAEFEVDPRTAESDTLGFLEELRHEGLLERASRTGLMA